MLKLIAIPKKKLIRLMKAVRNVYPELDRPIEGTHTFDVKAYLDLYPYVKEDMK